eukprot:764456-Hanusia_phi.AAC.2
MQSDSRYLIPAPHKRVRRLRDRSLPPMLKVSFGALPLALHAPSPARRFHRSSDVNNLQDGKMKQPASLPLSPCPCIFTVSLSAARAIQGNQVATIYDRQNQKIKSDMRYFNEAYQAREKTFTRCQAGRDRNMKELKCRATI